MCKVHAISPTLVIFSDLLYFHQVTRNMNMISTKLIRLSPFTCESFC